MNTPAENRAAMERSRTPARCTPHEWRLPHGALAQIHRRQAGQHASTEDDPMNDFDEMTEFGSAIACFALVALIAVMAARPDVVYAVVTGVFA